MSADDLRAVRHHLELTQAGMGERLGVAVRTIVNWETRGVPACRVPRIRRTLGTALQAALDGRNRSVEATYAARKSDSTTPRAHPLHPFTDLDLLTELQARALRREATRAA